MIWILLQVVLGLILVWPFNGWGYDAKALPGYAVVILGLAGLFWTLRHNRPANWQARPEIKPGADLILTGPYQWVRHPMYVATLIFLFGFVLLDRHWMDAAAWLLMALTFLFKSRIEDRLLREKFADYEAYYSSTGAFFPRL